MQSCRIASLQCKEVINICDGARLGYVGDVEIAVDTGRVVAIVVPGPWGFLSFLRPGDEHVILWEDIERIGEDIILVKKTQPPRTPPRPRRRGCW